MTCDDVQERLSAFTDGELSDTEAAESFRHAGTCRHCRDFLGSLVRVRSGVSRLPLFHPSPALDERIAFIRLPEEAGATTASARAGLQRLWTRSMRVPAAALAAGVALFLLTTALTLWFWIVGPKPPAQEVIYVFGLPQVEVVSTTGVDGESERTPHE